VLVLALLGSLPDELVVDGTVKSDVVCGVPLTAEATVGVGSVVVLALVPLEPVLVLAVLGGSLVVDAVLAVVGVADDDTRLMLLVDVPTERLPGGIAALSDVAAAPSVANRPELVAVAEGLLPAVTEKVVVPSLDCSHGRPDAAGPPSRLAPMT
jgi:hypothetical protein